MAEPPVIPTWRKVFGVGFAVAVLGVLVFGVFYSYLTGTPAQDFFDRTVWIIVVALMVIMAAIGLPIFLRDYYRQYS